MCVTACDIVAFTHLNAISKKQRSAHPRPMCPESSESPSYLCQFLPISCTVSRNQAHTPIWKGELPKFVWSSLWCEGNSCDNSIFAELQTWSSPQRGVRHRAPEVQLLLENPYLEWGGPCPCCHVLPSYLRPSDRLVQGLKLQENLQSVPTEDEAYLCFPLACGTPPVNLSPLWGWPVIPALLAPLSDSLSWASLARYLSPKYPWPGHHTSTVTRGVTSLLGT